MLSWAAKRRLEYFGVIFLTLLIIVGTPLFFYFYDRPTCFDKEQNGGELGVDCGGSCRLLCPFQIVEPVVLWSRSFEVVNGVYNAVAYVKNPNVEAATEQVSYTFELFDSKNISIAIRKGDTFILPGSITPVFESGISAGARTPVRTFFELTSTPVWYRQSNGENPLSVSGEVLTGENSSPRVNAVLKNSSVRNIPDIEVVTVVFNALGNAIASSKTVVDFLPKQSSANLVFTWPKPFTKELEACTVPVDVMLLIDVSGSMNDDNESPPQPLADAKRAAEDFAGRLAESDQSGLVSFATSAEINKELTFNHDGTISAIASLDILPKEESGSTNIGDAIQLAVDELALVGRPPDEESRQVIVLLTDGRANAPIEPGGEEYAVGKATLAEDRGYLLYTIGLGDQVNGEFLKTIASSPQESYLAATSKDLDRIYRQISDALCERGPAVIEVIPKSYDATFNY